ncbi:MAG: hypothetical protein Aurels2KO_31480 [Aureliella sp.]
MVYLEAESHPVRGNSDHTMQSLPAKDQLVKQSSLTDLDAESGSDTPPEPPVKLERFQTLEHAIRDTPITHDPYVELSKIYIGQKRHADARRVLDKAMERFSDVEEVVYLREEAMVLRSRQLVAEVTAEHKEEPTRLSQEKLDRTLLEFNVLRENVCRDRLARHPDQDELYIPLAAALDHLGKRSEAIVALAKAMENPNLRAGAGWQLGQLHEQAGEVPEALAAYRRAALFRIPRPPADIRRKALAAAADLAEKSGLIDSARRYVALLLELTPDDQTLSERLQRLNHTPL